MSQRCYGLTKFLVQLRLLSLIPSPELVDGTVLFCFSATPAQPSVQDFVSKSSSMNQETMEEILAPLIQHSRDHNVSSDRSLDIHSSEIGVSEHFNHQSDPLPQWLNTVSILYNSQHSSCFLSGQIKEKGTTNSETT